MNNNDSFYFYHLIPSNVILGRRGLYSPEYCYRNNMFEEYEKMTNKYRARILQYFRNKQNESELTLEEVHEGINILRNDDINGNNRIYFFMYLPYKSLGNNMRNTLLYKKAYRIDINDNYSKRYILYIDWGYELSDSRNSALNKKYYKNINEEEYFNNYNDQYNPLFATLNHIAIIPRILYLPLDILEEVEIK